MFNEEISFSEKHNLPKCTALYGVYKDEELLYVGVSWNLNNRFKTHHRLDDFCKEAATIVKWKEYEDKAKLYEDEHNAIRTLFPRLNVALNRRSTIRPVFINNMVKPEFKGPKNKNLNCNFYKFIFNLVWEYLDSSKNRKDAIKDLAKLTGLTSSWLESFARAKVTSPGSDKLEILYFHLTGKTLEL